MCFRDVIATALLLKFIEKCLTIVLYCDVDLYRKPYRMHAGWFSVQNCNSTLINNSMAVSAIW